MLTTLQRIKLFRMNGKNAYSAWASNKLSSIDTELLLLKRRYENTTSDIDKEKLKQQGLELREIEAFLKRDLVAQTANT